MPPTEPQTRHSLLRRITAAVSVAFLLVGVLGFVPGITADHGSLEPYGHESEAMLLGIFQVSWLHNALHLLLGAAGLASLRSDQWARRYLSVGGSAYALLFLFGLFIPDDHRANVVPLNNADNLLHLALAATMLGASFLVHGRDRDDDWEPPIRS